MYKSASDRKQAALHRGGPWDWAHGEIAQSHEDELDAVKRALRGIEEEIVTWPVGSDRRRKLGQRKIGLQTRSKELKALVGRERKCSEGIAQFFVEVAKEKMLPGEFHRVWEEAERRLAEEMALVDAAAKSNFDEK